MHIANVMKNLGPISDELKEEIVKGIFWGTAEEVEAYAINDNANRWYYHEHEWKTIKRELKAELRKC